jgi:hypothetical protein
MRLQADAGAGTAHSKVLAMIAIVIPPGLCHTGHKVFFIALAIKIVQPDRALSSPEALYAHCIVPRTAHLPTGHARHGIVIVDIVADGAPYLLKLDLDTAA